MKKRNAITTGQIVSCAIMLLALAWLLVSLPFVTASQNIEAQITHHQGPSEDDNSANPFANSEEINENGGSTISEFLHDHHFAEHDPPSVVRHPKTHSSNLYLAFHPELISPPPEA